MTFWDHLDVLRGSLFRALGVTLAVSVGLFFFKEFLFDGIILAPARGDFFVYRWLGIAPGLTLVNIEVATNRQISNSRYGVQRIKPQRKVTLMWVMNCAATSILTSVSPGAIPSHR